MTRLLCFVISVVFFSAACAQPADAGLYESIVNGETEKLTLFLASGGSPSATIEVPQSHARIALLELAVRAGNENATAALLRAGAQPDDVVALLEMAAEKGFSGVVSALLDEDPALVARMRPENHPLVLAVAGGHYDVASAFLRKMTYIPGRAEVEDVLNQALLVAIAQHDPDAPTSPLIGDLLNAGADPVSTAALAGAVLTCDPTLVSTFLAKGADARRPYDLGRGPAYLAQYAVRCFENTPDNAERILSDLASSGADPCAVDWTDARMPERARRYLRETESCN